MKTQHSKFKTLHHLMFSYNLNDHPLPDPNAYRSIVGALQLQYLGSPALISHL